MSRWEVVEDLVNDGAGWVADSSTHAFRREPRQHYQGMMMMSLRTLSHNGECGCQGMSWYTADVEEDRECSECADAKRLARKIEGVLMWVMAVLGIIVLVLAVIFLTQLIRW